MDNEQYKKLMWHLLYVESLLENVAEATGGANMNVQFAKLNSLHFFRLA